MPPPPGAIFIPLDVICVVVGIAPNTASRGTRPHTIFGLAPNTASRGMRPCAACGLTPLPDSRRARPFTTLASIVVIFVVVFIVAVGVVRPCKSWRMEADFGSHCRLDWQRCTSPLLHGPPSIAPPGLAPLSCSRVALVVLVASCRIAASRQTRPRAVVVAFVV